MTTRGSVQQRDDTERRGTVTLLYSAHDVRHNGALVLRDYLAERPAGGRGGKRQGHRPSARAPRARKSPAKGRAA